MSTTEQHGEQTTEAHEGPIKTPKQLAVTVVLAFIIPVILIIMLVNLVAASSHKGSGSDAQTEESIAQRIQPVAQFTLVDASAPKELKTGEQVYNSTCAACHNAGVAGAPKLGDTAAWAPFIKEGYEALVKNALNGINAMPPKGGNPSLADLEVERAVVFMANKSGASFDEPQAPAEGEAKPDESAQAAAPAAAAPAAAPAAEQAAPAQAAAPAPAAEAPAAQQTAAAEIDPRGEKLYNQVCMACHAAGVAGAPKFGDSAAWAKYIETGMDTMVQKVITGVGAMPPRGGSQASDDEIRAAVQYMVQAAQ